MANAIRTWTKIYTNPNLSKNIVISIVVTNIWSIAIFGYKKYVLLLGNLMVALEKSFEPIQNKASQANTKSIAETMVVANFLPTVTCWV